MWFNNPGDKEVKKFGGFVILNGYEAIDRNIFAHLRKIVEPEDTK